MARGEQNRELCVTHELSGFAHDGNANALYRQFTCRRELPDFDMGIQFDIGILKKAYAFCSDPISIL